MVGGGPMLEEYRAKYPEVEFVRVMPTDTWWMADELQNLPNLRQISFRDFVMEADIGQIATV